MKWYEYRQNNSGGVFTLPARYVWVQAHSADEANAIATKHNVYFNGCATGIDCPCCGDRWYTPWDDDGNEFPTWYDLDARTQRTIPLEDSTEPYTVVLDPDDMFGVLDALIVPYAG